MDRMEQRFVTTSGQLMLDGFGDEAAAVPFESINPIDQLGGQGDGDAFCDAHAMSMT